MSDINAAFSDILLLFASFMVFLVMGNLVPDGRNWALLTIGVTGFLVTNVLVGIYVSPPGMSFYKWLKCKIGFWSGSDYRSATDGDSGRITKDAVSTNGERCALEDLTRVDGFAPQAAGVWRFDGALVGGCEIDPAELSLASKAAWEAAADELGDVINGLDHSGQLRNGSIKIDTEAIKRRFGERLGDPDVRSNPQLRQNVDMYKQKLASQMDSKNASLRGFQFLAPVTMEEVQMQGHRVLGRLNDIPVIGPQMAGMLASRDLTVAEIRYRQERVLKERRDNLEKDLSGITGCDAEQLSMDDVINVLEESWTGERVVSEERDDRSLPLVTMSREYTETEGDTRSPDQLADDELDRQILNDLQKSAAPVEETSDPDPEGTTDLSDEDYARGTVSDDDLDDEPEMEPEPEPEPPEPEVPDQAQNGTGATPDDEGEGEAEATDSGEVELDESNYDSLEDLCAAYVEEKERVESEHSGEENQHTDSESDSERQEATI